MQPPAIQKWSTSDVLPRHRLDYYASALAEAVTPVIVSSDERQFDAEMHFTSLGSLAIGRQSGKAHVCERTVREIQHSNAHSMHLVLNLHSSFRISHAGAVRLRPGDMALIDSERESWMELSQFEVVHLRMQPEWLRQWLPAHRMLLGRSLSGASGWGHALSAYLRQLTPELVASGPLPSPVLADQIGSLLALLAGNRGVEIPTSRHDKPLRNRIQDCIAQRCADLSLTATDVAATLGISPRTLFRALASCGETFGASLIAARAELALRMLHSRGFDGLTTAEIGRRAGFSDASHFARVIRKRLGHTPAQVRRNR